MLLSTLHLAFITAFRPFLRAGCRCHYGNEGFERDLTSHIAKFCYRMEEGGDSSISCGIWGPNDVIMDLLIEARMRVCNFCYSCPVRSDAFNLSGSGKG